MPVFIEIWTSYFVFSCILGLFICFILLWALFCFRSYCWTSCPYLLSCWLFSVLSSKLFFPTERTWKATNHLNFATVIQTCSRHCYWPGFWPIRLVTETTNRKSMSFNFTALQVIMNMNILSYNIVVFHLHDWITCKITCNNKVIFALVLVWTAVHLVKSRDDFREP